MTIALDEAERLYPIHHADIMDGDPIDAMQPAIDVLQNEAYVKGRTAEPCEEQVKAVVKEMGRHLAYRFDEKRQRVCDCGEVIPPLQSHAEHKARAYLDIARRTVM